MNGPPSSGHDVMAGSWSSAAGTRLWTTGASVTRFMPTFSSSRPTSRAPHNVDGVGGRIVSARWTSRLIRRSGRSPNASSARRAVPNRLVTSRNGEPATLVNSSAGPPAAITRRWISATSSLRIDARVDGDHVAVAPKLVDERAEIGKAHLGVSARAVDVRHLRPHRAEVGRELATMVDAVVVREGDEVDARHLHEAHEVELFGRACRLAARPAPAASPGSSSCRTRRRSRPS